MALAGPGRAQAPTTLEVRVRTEAGTPLAGAVVRARRGEVVAAEARTGTDGLARLVDLPTGSLAIEVQAPGYRPAQKMLLELSRAQSKEKETK